MANQCNGILVYGRRRVKPYLIAVFKEKFAAHAVEVVAADSKVKAFFAFPDCVDPTAFYHVFMSTGCTVVGNDVLTGEELPALYSSTPENPDVLEVYGGWAQEVPEGAASSVRYRYHAPLAGFIKSDGAGEAGPPMFGFTRRFVQPGQLDKLASNFQRVCDLWHELTPGILCATVSCNEDDPPNMVHDLRIFANKKAYDQHVDKSNEVLTAAMHAWFECYDRSVPFEGELFIGRSTDEEGLHSSSIKTSTTARPQMAMFYFGPDMLGAVPDMTRGERF